MADILGDGSSEPSANIYMRQKKEKMYITRSSDGASAACNFTVRASEPGALHRAVASLAFTLSSINSAADVTVCLGPGTHSLNGISLQLGREHNHPHGGRIVWRGSEATTISAGAPLQKWARCSDGKLQHCSSAAWHNVWAHAVSDVPYASRVASPFRQLWVRGRRVARVASPADTLLLNATNSGYVAANHWALDGSESWVADEVELRWPKQIKNWIEPRCVLSAVSGASLTVAPKCWRALIARNGNKLPPPPQLIENIVRPPPPGEFVSSAGFIYYSPPVDKPYAAPADAWVPLLGAIVNASGVANHTFANLTFSHATWRIPSSSDGYVPDQSAVTPAEGEPLGGVRFANASGLLIEHCAFRNIGAAYALSVGSASQMVTIRRSAFEDLSGGAMKLGNVLDGRELTIDPVLMDIGYTVADNTLSSAALEWQGAAAIFAGYLANTTIEHNSIRDTGYTAISLGWGWGKHVLGAQTYASNNHVVGNRMSGVMSALDDGGCVYTLGPQPNSTVSDNYCDADRAPVVGSFYHDNGSRFFTTTRNVASSSSAPCLYLQGCCGAPALDIRVSKLWCRDEGALLNRCAQGTANCSQAYPGVDADCHCEVDSATVHTMAKGSAWPKEAQAIVRASGVRQ